MTYIKLDKIRTIEELRKYKENWDQILESNQNTNPFIEFEWIVHWWLHLGKDKNIEILVVEDNDKWIGFFPFQFTNKWNSTLVEFVARDEADYMDVIVYDKDKKAAIPFILNYLITSIPNVVFNLHGLLSSSKTTTNIMGYLKSRDYPTTIFSSVTPYIHIESIDLNDYMKPRKKLHGLNRREKRIQLIGDLTTASVDPSDMETVFSLHDKHWKQKLDTSKFKNQAHKDFYHALLSVKDRPIEVKVDALFLNDQMIAFTYGFMCRGRYVSFIIGHDDDYNLYSPGRILMNKLIEHSRKHGIKIFDLSVGDDPYKLDWNTGLDTVNNILFSSNEWPAKLLVQLIKSRGYVRTVLNKNHNMVLFKRQILGRTSHLLRHVKDMNWLKSLTNLRGFLFSNKSLDVYHQCKGNSAIGDFQLMTHEEIMKEEKEFHHVNKKFYSGFLPYRAADASIFWVNARAIRLDEVDYLQTLPKQSFFVNEWQVHQLPEICSFLRHEHQVRDIYISTTKRDESLTKHLSYLGFTKVNCISKISMFNKAITSITSRSS
ncbi:GNAT family N-acetyltransferase [Paenisporosarcina indica]|uniref:GNAT family N-acetyltransferase n=1 Tax=Paenisporosarcina indica TaxID=650093 RepID=UPI00094F6890|nr:GNAT family N-acetyltransferase [Paenisporosarcina indica]